MRRTCRDRRWPLEGNLHKLTSPKLLIICLLLPSLKVLGFNSFLQSPKAALTDRQRKATAFVLGWNSKMILVQRNPKDRERLFLAIKRQVRDLGVELRHPLDYYFTDPMLDQGATAQAFADEMFGQLEKTNINVANHFGAAHNLLLNLRDSDTAAYIRKAELQELVTVLDIPEELKQVPDHGIPEWASAIKVYFESSLPPRSRTGRRKPENRSYRKGPQELTGASFTEPFETHDRCAQAVRHQLFEESLKKRPTIASFSNICNTVSKPS